MSGERIGEVVAFLEMKNARGYPASGKIVDHDDTHAIVEVWGLVGPGSETTVNGVPFSAIRRCNEQPEEGETA